MTNFSTSYAVNMQRMVIPTVDLAQIPQYVADDPFFSATDTAISFGEEGGDEGENLYFNGLFKYTYDAEGNISGGYGFVSSIYSSSYYHDYDVDPEVYHQSYREIAGFAISTLDFDKLSNSELVRKIFAFDDEISGSDANDIIDGFAGADKLVGGQGDDVYFVDDIKDTVVEAKGGGSDTVKSSISYLLAAGTQVEMLRTTNDAGTAEINLRGNEIANKIAGNAGSNLLSGFAGNDTLAGYGGNDRIVGGLGADTSYGGAGNDVFVFDAAAESGITSTTRDRIVDFARGDRIDVSDIDAKVSSAFSGNQAFVLDDNKSFSIGEIRQTVVGGNLLLEFNTDGDTAAEMSILLLTQAPLVSADFVL